MSQRMFEPLEGRRLFASTGFVGYIAPVIGPIAEVTALRNGTVDAGTSSTPTATPAAGPRPTDLKADWEGKVTVKIVVLKKQFDAELEITGQTDKSITGSVTIDGHEHSGTFTGKINPKNGKFKYKLKDGRESITLSGTLDRKGSYMFGKVEGKYDGWKVTGKFEFNDPTDPNATPIT